MWGLRQQAKVSGFGILGSGDKTTDSSDTIDATTDEGIMEMQAQGLPVKRI
jgi:hypothetical protein